MQLLRAILIGLGLALVAGFAHAEEEGCDLSLTVSRNLRYFRASETNHASTRNGIYTFQKGQLRHDTDLNKVYKLNYFENAASHIAIVRQLLGAATFDRALRTNDPRKSLAMATKDFIRRRESTDTVRRLRAEVDQIPGDEDLPEGLSNRILEWYRHRGRLASPLMAWLKPKLASSVLQRSEKATFRAWPNVQLYLRPESYVYKAVIFTVRLNGVQTLTLSAPASGTLIDNHAFIVEEVKLILPASRILSHTAGYILVQPTHIDLFGISPVPIQRELIENAL